MKHGMHGYGGGGSYGGMHKQASSSMEGMNYNGGGKGGLGGKMNLGGFGNSPAPGRAIPPGKTTSGVAWATGDAGREHDPNEGKQRRDPGNP